MNDQKKDRKREPKFAPGIDEEKAVYQDATKEDIKKGNTTKVTRVFLDENDPG